MLDIYVWSIEDKHSVRVETKGAILILAQFLDKQVACNFRDWVKRTIESCDLYAYIDYAARRQPIPEHLVWIGELIAARRQHPAADEAYYDEIEQRRVKI